MWGERLAKPKKAMFGRILTWHNYKNIYRIINVKNTDEKGRETLLTLPWGHKVQRNHKIVLFWRLLIARKDSCEKKNVVAPIKRSSISTAEHNSNLNHILQKFKKKIQRKIMCFVTSSWEINRQLTNGDHDEVFGEQQNPEAFEVSYLDKHNIHTRVAKKLSFLSLTCSNQQITL